MSSEEKWLREMFRERAGSVEATGDFTGPAVALAGRRRRRAAVAAVAAGVVAVAGVGVATWAVAGPEVPAPVPATRTTAPPSPSPSASSPSPSATASPTPTPTPSESSTPTPAPPSTPYALDGTVHLGDGTLDVAAGRVVSDLAELEGGRLLVRIQAVGEPRSGRWQVLDGSGQVVAELGSGADADAVTDGRVIALGGAEWGDDVRAFDSRGRALGTHPGGAVPTAVAGGRVVLDGINDSMLWDPLTGDERTLPDGSRGLSADGRFALGTTGYDEVGGTRCWFAADLSRSTPTKTLERCGDRNPDDFGPRTTSADGRYILGSHAADGGSTRGFVVVDATDGHVVLGPSTDGEHVTGWSTAFEGSGREILFSRSVGEPGASGARNDLVRCTLALACTRVGPALTLDAGPAPEPRYVVARPFVP